jgi:hypothetical protein
MPITFDAATYGGETPSTTSDVTAHTVASGTGRFLVVGVWGSLDIDNVTGITYAGTPMTLILKQAGSGTMRAIYLYGLANPATGTNNVIVSSSPADYVEPQIASYLGASAMGASAIREATGFYPFTVTVTTTADQSWLAGFFGSNVGIVPWTATTQRMINTNGTVILGDSNGPLSVGSNFLEIAWGGGTSILNRGIVVELTSVPQPAKIIFQHA